MPVHKHLDQDRVLFVHKGQGRATVNERVVLVVHGAMLYVPRGAWHSLRNTGTGALEIAWASSPPGVEDYFRDLSHVGASPSAQALQELAQRHRIEFRQATEAPAASGHRHHGRRGGRRHRGGRGPASSAAPGQGTIVSSTSAQPSSTASGVSGVGPAPSTTPAAPAASSAPRGRRRRRRGHGGSRQPSGLRHSLAGEDSAGSVAGQQLTPPATVQRRREEGARPPAPVTPAPASGSARPDVGRQRSSRRPRPRRVREVYMGGRWIQVEGEGTVIAPGRMGPEHRGRKRGEKDEPPNTPLSVSL